MYVSIRDIIKASVCGFCENIYEYNSIDEKEFVEFLKDFLFEDDLQSCLERCTADIIYDYVNIENICNDNLNFKINKDYEIGYVISNCKEAYLKTLEKDKTINMEAFVDNLTKQFSS